MVVTSSRTKQPVKSSARPKRRSGQLHIHERPLPPKPPELAWRDYLIMLLKIAAELEQSLMVQYLFAAYSLGGDDAHEHERKVHEWRDAILTIAREEMGHLLTVQNCICLLGKSDPPKQRVRVCVECGMPVAEHKEWCSIRRGQLEMKQSPP